MRWILDDGPFGWLAKDVDLEEARHWEPDVLLVANTTLATSSTPRNQALLELRASGRPIVTTFEIRIGAHDPAEEVLVELHPDTSSTTDLAEHESIAWAQVHGLDSVFVSADRRASLTALAELGSASVPRRGTQGTPPWEWFRMQA